MKSHFFCAFLFFVATQVHQARCEDEEEYDDMEDLDEFRESLTWGRIFLDRGVTNHQYFKARFGGDIPTGSHPIVPAEPILGCGPIKNADAVKGAIAVVNRGECTYATKARSLQKAGAIGVLIKNNEDQGLTHPPGPDGTDVTIAVAMITHEFGNLLHRVTKVEPTRAQLMPIYCEKESGVSVCLPVTEQEKEQHVVTEGGVLEGGEFKAEFLTAKFGAPIPTKPLILAASDPSNGCGDLDSSKLTGKAVLLRRGGCTFLDKVSNAQKAGAAAAIVINTQPGILRMDSLKRYESYNISTPTVMISTEKGDELQEKLTAGAEISVEFKDTGLKASVWDNLRNEVAAEQWPLEPEEALDMYKGLLKHHMDSDERTLYLQDAFRDTGVEAEEYLEAEE
jgi:hypothetical protein